MNWLIYHFQQQILLYLSEKRDWRSKLLLPSIYYIIIYIFNSKMLRKGRTLNEEIDCFLTYVPTCPAALAEIVITVFLVKTFCSHIAFL